MNKKFDRFKQWAGERMGGEVKTNTSDDFKALEMEMMLRHEGMEKLQRSMTMYIKSLSKRSEVDGDREKYLPVSYLGSTMISHGEDFEPDSEFGNCMQDFGRANERIGRMQESYVSNATSSWLEGLERSLAQMKEYQAARKKLENRRLAYDASLAKMQKQKKEDFRVEEDLRAQKAKYEESSEDVYRRMQDIKEAEGENVADLTAFLDAELAYYDRCREIVMQVKRDWPAGNRSTPEYREGRRGPRSRSNTAHSYAERYAQGAAADPDDYPPPVPSAAAATTTASEPKLTIPRTVSASSNMNNIGSSPYRDVSPTASTASIGGGRPGWSRASTFEQPTAPGGATSRLSRMPTEPLMSSGSTASSSPAANSIAASRSRLRPVTSNPKPPAPNGTNGAGGYYNGNGSANGYANGHANGHANGADKAPPPPPPPSRAKKPPPPPPAKRVGV
ncbi:hypothetical protein BDY21DRAFT_286659 [Lineolata rhizophorae]|uniref:BAR domain-containing protein n=1 Tax=Lineolata rhizophorae TaxID=578093 RepID=A0A6A6NZF6_9PEZI|nr:hypothetical protein BDY21DRAFT_286659 [Lineolata rhizophorae]